MREALLGPVHHCARGTQQHAELAYCQHCFVSSESLHHGLGMHARVIWMLTGNKERRCRSCKCLRWRGGRSRVRRCRRRRLRRLWTAWRPLLPSQARPNLLVCVPFRRAKWWVTSKRLRSRQGPWDCLLAAFPRFILHNGSLYSFPPLIVSVHSVLCCGHTYIYANLGRV